MPTKIQNLKRLDRKLQRLPEAAIKAIRPAMEKGAQQIVDMAKRFVPVNTGKLRDSIGWTWGSSTPKGSIAIGQVKGGELTITIFAGNDEAFQARWVEFGTIAMRAQPYFFPAYRALRRTVKSRIKRAVNAAAKAEAKGS